MDDNFGESEWVESMGVVSGRGYQEVVWLVGVVRMYRCG